MTPGTPRSDGTCSLSYTSLKSASLSGRTLMAALKRYRVWIGMAVSFGVIEPLHPSSCVLLWHLGPLPLLAVGGAAGAALRAHESFEKGVAPPRFATLAGRRCYDDEGGDYDVRWHHFSPRLRRSRRRHCRHVQQARRPAPAIRGGVVGHRRPAQAPD